MTTIPWAAGQPVAPARRRAIAGLRRPSLPDPWSVAIPVLAGGLVALGIALGWRGGDLPAQIYRVESIRRDGLALWDSQWFAGHWMLGYSVLEPAVAALVGLGVLSVLSASAAALAFHRLVTGHFATGAARASSLVFAGSVIVETAIGQIPFLAGEAVALWCCVALARRRPVMAAVAAVSASLLSPLAAAFLALAVGAWLVASWWPGGPARQVTSLLRRVPIGARLAQRLPSVISGADLSPLRRPALGRPALGRSGAGASGTGASGTGRWAPARLRAATADRLGRPGSRPAVVVLVAVGVPLGLVGLLFPGQGPMPYPVVDCLWELVIAAALLAVTPVSEPVLRTGIAGFAVTAAASELFPSALGGNVGRIEDCLALPLAVALLWPRRRWLLVVLAVPLVLSQWGPAWGAMTSDAGHPWMSQAYYRPVVRWLHAAGGPTGRVEVVPTADHWESAYIAPTIALARGWERQLDVADNPIFYDPGELTPTTYLSWLLDNGVRYVALPSAPLDYAGVAEGQLVAAGVPGLHEVTHTSNWRVYKVDGASGIVSGPGYLSQIDGSRVSVVVDRPGTVEVRVHDNPAWKVASGPATIEPSADGWILVQAATAGTVQLSLGLPEP